MLDEVNLAVAFNDVDLCLKLQKFGHLNVYTPYAVLIHHESLSRGGEDTPEKRARLESEIAHMKQKWGTEEVDDCYCNPNLVYAHMDFSLASHKINSLHHGYPLRLN